MEQQMKILKRTTPDPMQEYRDAVSMAREHEKSCRNELTDIAERICTARNKLESLGYGADNREIEALEKSAELAERAVENATYKTGNTINRFKMKMAEQAQEELVPALKTAIALYTEALGSDLRGLPRDVFFAALVREHGGEFTFAKMAVLGRELAEKELARS
jgi:hypothetical protein